MLTACFTADKITATLSDDVVYGCCRLNAFVNAHKEIIYF